MLDYSDIADDEGASGWIATSDAFLLTTVLLLGVVWSLFQKQASDRAQLTELTETISRLSATTPTSLELERELATLLNGAESDDERLTQVEALKERLASITKLERELQATREALNAEREAHAQIAAQMKELEKAKEMATRLSAEVARLKQELAQLQGRLDRELATNRQLKEALAVAEKRAERAQGLLRERSEQILKPLSRALLTIRIRSRNLPESLDLDLYVQDPLDRICSWRNPRIQSKRAEMATLIPSEYLQNIEVNDGEVDANAVTEEAYYSSEIVPGSTERPYLVFCMLRETAAQASALKLEQPVEWELVYNAPDSPSIRRKGTTVVPRSGKVMVQASGDLYLRLFPLAAFQVTEDSDRELVALERDQIPDLPRGWQKNRLQEGAAPYVKFPDQNQN
ncbi:MAG: hypothetical protein ACKOFW_22360 [Planctomycetaceae bacterium]